MTSELVKKKTMEQSKRNRERPRLPHKTIQTKIPWASGFCLPKERDVHRALGIDRSLQHSKTFQSSVHFDRIPFPISDKDWLANTNEEGQSYLQFIGSSPWLKSKKAKDYKGTFFSSGCNILDKYPDAKIYLLNLEAKDKQQLGESLIDMISLKEFLEIYHGIPVKILPKANIIYNEDENKLLAVLHADNGQKQNKPIEPTFRRDKDYGHIQMRIDTGLVEVTSLMPDDGIFLVAVTMMDLYGDKTDLFTVGTGSAAHRLGIFSFKRYDPCFVQNSEENWFDYSFRKDSDIMQRKNTILQRSCKTLVHEVGHLLGIKHCIYYSCCMNGSGHLDEDFRQPIHLCPVDLRKIEAISGIDVKERYVKLAKFYKEHGMGCDKCWVDSRVKYISL